MEDLESVDGIGAIVAQAIFEWFKAPENQELIERLKTAGVNMEIEVIEVGDGPFKDKTVVITGTLPSLSRDDASAMIESAAGVPLAR